MIDASHGLTDKSRYQLLSDASYATEGMPFLRVSTPATEGAASRTRAPLPDSFQSGSLFISIEARSRTAASVSLSLHSLEFPEAIVWETTMELDNDWQAQTWRVDIPPQARLRKDLTLQLDTRGSYDMAMLRVDPVTTNASSGSAAENLLRSTRFPLGMPTGWALARDLDDREDVRVDTDTSMTGPSGTHPLQIRNVSGRLPDRGRGTLSSPPFIWADPGQLYTYSFHAKGSGELTVSIYPGGDQYRMRDRMASATFSLEDNWKQYHLTFVAGLNASWHFAAFTVEEEAWMDALKLEAGPSLSPYAEAIEPEVALAPSDTFLPGKGISFAPSPLKIDYALSGDWQDHSLHLSMSNIRGVSRSIVVEQPSERDTLNLDLFPEAPFGSFQIEAWLSRDGERVGKITELVVHRLRKPRHWLADAPDSPWGVHVNPVTRHLNMAKAIGINWVRLHDAGLHLTGWSYLEPEKGTWHFHDKGVLRYRNARLKINAQLGTTPGWASYWQSSLRASAGEYGYFDRKFQPKDLNEWTRYVRTIVARYRDEIDTWCIWNEPYWPSGWVFDYRPGDPKARHGGFVHDEDPASSFTRLMKATYGAVKEINPTATVVGACTRHGADRPEIGPWWTSELKRVGGLAHTDVLEYHHYSRITGLLHPEDEVRRGLLAAYQPILDEDGNIPRRVWMTEGQSVRSNLGNGLYRRTVPPGEKEDTLLISDSLVRYCVSILVNNVEKVFLYTMHGHGAMAPINNRAWRVLVTSEGSLHPSATAFAHMAWMLDGLQFQRIGQLDDNVFVYIFSGNGRNVMVIAPRNGSRGERIPIPEGCSATDLFGNPLSGEMKLDGEVLFLSSSAPEIDLWTRLGVRNIQIEPFTPWSEDDIYPIQHTFETW